MVVLYRYGTEEEVYYERYSEEYNSTSPLSTARRFSLPNIADTTGL